MKAFLIAISVGIASASGTELRISFEPPQSVAAIRISGREKDDLRFDVYRSFEYVQRDATQFKAADCLHVFYSKNVVPGVSRSGTEEGSRSVSDTQTLFRFTKPIKDVQRIDFAPKDKGMVAYVFTKDLIYRVFYDRKQEPSAEKINRDEVPVAPPRLTLVVPDGKQPPTFKN